jgi:hypothetical protein
MDDSKTSSPTISLILADVDDNLHVIDPVLESANGFDMTMFGIMNGISLRT